MKTRNFILLLCTFMTLNSCGENKPNKIYDGGTDTAYPMSDEDARKIKRGKLTGDEGLSLLGMKGQGRDLRSDVISHGVNAYLWQAAIDTISFMPIQAVDATGGVIITDWYQDPNSGGEKIKANIVISSAELRASGVRVTLFRQTSGGKTAPGSADAERKLEDKILARAREIRIEEDRF
jgi:hypothetical protein